MGVEVPAHVREQAWRFAYFTEWGGGATSSKRLNISALPEDEKKRRQEAAERAWKVFCEVEAPKRLAARRVAVNAPPPEAAKGKEMSKIEFEAWLNEKQEKERAAKMKQKAELAQMHAAIEAMVEARNKGREKTALVITLTNS